MGNGDCAKDVLSPLSSFHEPNEPNAPNEANGNRQWNSTFAVSPAPSR